MKLFYRLLIASLASVAVAIGLSVVPKLDSALQPVQGDTPVFRAETPVVLTDRNLVDLLIRQPLRLAIAHVEWEDSILSIDLRAPEGHVDPGVFYEDMFELSRFSFAGTKNVTQLLVRAVEPRDSSFPAPRLLLAMDAKRSDLEAKDLESSNHSKLTAEQFLSSHFNLTYTHVWMERYRRE